MGETRVPAAPQRVVVLDTGELDSALALGEAVSGASPSVSLVRFNPGRTRIFGVASFGGSIAYDAGLARPPAQRVDATSQDLTTELLDRLDGDWIFYSVQGAADKTPAADILRSPLWAGLGAVKAGRAVLVDDDPWYLNAGPSAAMLVLADLERTLGGGNAGTGRGTPR